MDTMDVSEILGLPSEEREFFQNVQKKEEWVNTIFIPYIRPLAIGIGIQNQFIDNVNQTVTQWKNHATFKKYTSLKRFKRGKKHKIYFTLIGPFPDYFFSHKKFNYEIKNSIKLFLEIFFPGKTVVFMGDVDHKDLNIHTRIHSKSEQLQLFLPDINTYLQKILPQDAFCVCGFSWYDFFPSPELNHVLGEGSIENGTAAFTFGHYALFKEKELLQAGKWKADYALEKPFDISDDLAKEKGGFYDFVTEKEKEEAKIFTIECDQEGCAGSKLVNSSSQPRLNISTLFNMTSFSNKNDALLSHVLPEPSEAASTEDEPEQGGECTNGFQSVAINSRYDESNDKALPPNTTFTLNCRVLRRLFRVMSHEICHILGMAHCQYFSCTMNTSSSVLHTDTQPLLLCPVCLRKLQLSSPFELKDRYKRLLQFLLLHTEVCDMPGLHREEILRMQETQVLRSDDVCLFKNDVQRVLSLLEVLDEKGDNLGFTKLDMEYADS